MGWGTLSRAGSNSLVLLLTVIAGCNASGQPRFVKISHDSQRIVCEDAQYARVYVYTASTWQVHPFQGKIACLTPDLRKIVLLDTPTGLLPQPLPLSLITTEDGRVEARALPKLPNQGAPYGDYIYFSFAESGRVIMAEVYPWYDDVVKAEGRFYQLTLGDSQWIETRVPQERQGGDPLRWLTPGGLLDGGYAYAPASGFAPDGKSILDARKAIGANQDGLDVWRDHTRDYRENILDSPDGSLRVRIQDADEPVARVTVTRIATGEKTVLLDRNDIPKYVLYYSGIIVASPIALPIWLVNPHPE